MLTLSMMQTQSLCNSKCALIVFEVSKFTKLQILRHIDLQFRNKTAPYPFGGIIKANSQKASLTPEVKLPCPFNATLLKKLCWIESEKYKKNFS